MFSVQRDIFSSLESLSEGEENGKRTRRRRKKKRGSSSEGGGGTTTEDDDEDEDEEENEEDDEEKEDRGMSRRVRLPSAGEILQGMGEGEAAGEMTKNGHQADTNGKAEDSSWTREELVTLQSRWGRSHPTIVGGRRTGVEADMGMMVVGQNMSIQAAPNGKEAPAPPEPSFVGISLDPASPRPAFSSLSPSPSPASGVTPGPYILTSPPLNGHHHRPSSSSASALTVRSISPTATPTIPVKNPYFLKNKVMPQQLLFTIIPGLP